MTSTTSSSTRTNLGPLTKTFVPPSTCSVLGVGAHSASVAYQAQHCFITTTSNGQEYTLTYANVADDPTCWPSTVPGVPSPSIPLAGWGVYSPGLLCPYGYETACVAARNTDGLPTSFTTGIPSFNFYFPLSAGETAAGCCPTHYDCITEDFGYQTCISTQSTGVIKVTSCMDGTLTSTFPITVPNTKPATPVYTLTAYAPLIQLVFQRRDLEAITIVQPTVTVGPTDKPSGGLNTGDKAGIGVGVVAAVLIALVAVLAWFLLRRRRRAAAPQGNDGNPFTEAPRDGGPGYGKERREIEGTPLSELESSAAELPGSRLLHS